jgi:hypothetical protein
MVAFQSILSSAAYTSDSFEADLLSYSNQLQYFAISEGSVEKTHALAARVWEERLFISPFLL